MSRVEENQKTIDQINKVSKNKLTPGEAVITSALLDISISLAIIADKMEVRNDS